MITAVETSTAHAGLSRRQALQVSGAAVLAASALASATGASAQEDPHAGHEHHAEMHGAEGHASSQHRALIEAAQKCVASAEACVPHCLGLIAKGDTSLAECLESVLAMSPVCTAVVRVASLQATRLKELVKVCGDICADCEKACRKHAEHHEVCKACADSCAAFTKEAKKLSDA